MAGVEFQLEDMADTALPEPSTSTAARLAQLFKTALQITAESDQKAEAEAQRVQSTYERKLSEQSQIHRQQLDAHQKQASEELMALKAACNNLRSQNEQFKLDAAAQEKEAARVYSQTVDMINQRHATELESVMLKSQTEIEELRQVYEKRLQTADTEKAMAMDKVVLSFKAERETMDLAFQEEKSKFEEVIQQERHSAQVKYQQVREDLTSKLDARQREYDAAMKKKDDHYRQELAKLKEDAKASQEEVLRGHAEELEGLRGELEQSRQANATLAEESRAAFQRALETNKSLAENEKHMMAARHDAEVENINSSWSLKLKAEIDRRAADEERLQLAQECALQEQEAQLSAAFRAKETQYLQKLREEEERRREEVRGITHTLSQEIEMLKAAHDHEVTGLTEHHEASIAKMRRDSLAAFTSEVESLKQRHQDEITSTNDNNSRYVNQLEEKQKAQLEEMKEKHSNEVKQWKKKCQDIEKRWMETGGMFNKMREWVQAGAEQFTPRENMPLSQPDSPKQQG